VLPGTTIPISRHRNRISHAAHRGLQGTADIRVEAKQEVDPTARANAAEAFVSILKDFQPVAEAGKAKVEIGPIALRYSLEQAHDAKVV